MPRLVIRSSAVNEQLMHLRMPSKLVILCFLTAGCASPVLPGHFHVDPVIASVTHGPDATLSADIHDQAVRSGRAQGWVDASSPDTAALRLAYVWRREGGSVSDRFRLVCRWRTADGGEGEITDGLAMPARFWTETRAGEAASRLCAVTIGTAGRGRRPAP